MNNVIMLCKKCNENIYKGLKVKRIFDIVYESYMILYMNHI